MTTFKDIRRDLDLYNSAIDNLPKDANNEMRKTLTRQIKELVAIVRETMDILMEGDETVYMKSQGKDTLVLTIWVEKLDTRKRYLDTVQVIHTVTREEFEKALREKEEAGQKKKKKR